jgi:hypothetical protein
MSDAAARMRRSRLRREVWHRRACIVEVDEDMVQSLVTQRFLKPGKEKDNRAIGAAVTKWLRTHRLYAGT